MRVSPSLLRGVEFGSPEYVRITKRGEEVGDFRGKSDQLVDVIDDIVIDSHLLRHTDYGNLAYVRDAIIGIIGTD